MRSGTAALFMSASSSDSVFEALCAAYAIHYGSVSLHDLTEQIREFWCGTGRYHTRIDNYRCLAKTGHRIRGTTQYIIDDQWALNNPVQMDRYRAIARELFE